MQLFNLNLGKLNFSGVFANESLTIGAAFTPIAGLALQVVVPEVAVLNFVKALIPAGSTSATIAGAVINIVEAGSAGIV